MDEVTSISLIEIMDMCTKCVEKQEWLLESGDGSQVVCICTDPFPESEDKENVVPATPKGVNSTTVDTNAPKRKRVEQKLWMNPGRDIRRNLFKEYNWRRMDEANGKRWAILRIENIQTSQSHYCTRRFYLGDQEGRNYLEIEFYPCVTYKDLGVEYKNQFHVHQRREHQLTYNPIRRSPPCKMAISKINDFIVFNDIEIILYNSEPGNINDGAELKICKKLGIPSLNISAVASDIVPPPYHDFGDGGIQQGSYDQENSSSDNAYPLFCKRSKSSCV